MPPSSDARAHRTHGTDAIRYLAIPSRTLPPNPRTIDDDRFAIFDAMSDIVAVTTGDGRLCFLNRAGRNTLGFRDDDPALLGGLFPMHTLAARELLFDEVVPAARALGQVNSDTALQSLDGRVFPASQTVIATPGIDGTVETLTFVIRDVSMDSQAAARVADSQRLFESITRSSPDLMFLYDPIDQRVLWMNRCIHAFLGGTERDARTLNRRELLRLVHKDDRVLVGEHAARMSAAYGDEMLAVDVRMRTSGARPRWISTRSTVFSRRETGAPLLLLGVATDVTARKQLETRLRHDRAEAEEATRLKTRFLTRMCREFRGSIHGIVGALTELERNRDCRLTARELEQVHETIERGTNLLETVADIRDFTAIESGEMTVSQEATELTEVIQATVASFAGHPTVVAQPVIVRTPAAPVALFTDGARLRQALTHIIGLALDYDTDRPLEVTLTTRAADGSPEAIAIHAAGWCVAPADHARLMEPFEPAECPSRTRWSRDSGTGLTLSLARALCEMLGCYLELATDPEDGGLTFRIELPAPTRAATLARHFPMPGPVR